MEPRANQPRTLGAAVGVDGARVVGAELVGAGVEGEAVRGAAVGEAVGAVPEAAGQEHAHSPRTPMLTRLGHFCFRFTCQRKGASRC